MSLRAAPESPVARRHGASAHSRRDLAALATSRPAGLAIAVAAALAAWQLPHIDLFGPTTGAPPAPLQTRSGAPATSHDDLARRLALLNRYIDRDARAPVTAIEDTVLDDVMAEILGREGRIRVSHVLDYTSELIARPRRRTRDQLFVAVDALNSALASREFGYYVFTSLQWNSDRGELERVAFDVYAIDGVQRYEVASHAARPREPAISAISALRVRRLDSQGPGDHRLGFTSAGHPDALVVPARIDHELRAGLIPALDPDGPTPLFQVSPGHAGAPWYRRLRRAVATILRDDFAAISGPSARYPDALVIRDALIRAVELHEIQHLLDFAHERRGDEPGPDDDHEQGSPASPPPLDGPFKRLAEYTGKPLLAREGFAETSAHLAQMARDPATCRITLAVVTSYAFTDQCIHGDCFAALAILDELAMELGYQAAPTLTGHDFYRLTDLAGFYTALASHSRDELSRAARATWERLFHRRLVDVTAI